MKRLFLCLLILISAATQAQTVFPGQSVNKYWISGSLSVGQDQINAIADPSVWLQIGKDTTTKGVIFPRAMPGTITTTKRGVFYYSLGDSSLHHFDGTTDVRYLTNKDSVGFSGKEPAITSGTTSQYWRGDKSWQTLDKTAVGLSNVDNTSDANKPVSTAAQSALDLKVNTSVVSTADITQSLDKTNTIPTQLPIENLIRQLSGTTIPTPYVWWDAESPRNTIGGSNKVPQIWDESGNGRHLTQGTTANQGTYVATGGFNNRPYISFVSGASPSKYTSSTLSLDTIHTFLWIAKMNEGVGSGGQYPFGSNTGNAMSIQYEGVRFVYNNAVIAFGYTGNNDYIILVTRTRGTDFRAWVNGTEIVTSKPASSQAFSPSGLGGHLGTGGQIPPMNWCVTAAWNRYLTDQEIDAVVKSMQYRYYGAPGTVTVFANSWGVGAGAGASTLNNGFAYTFARDQGRGVQNESITGTVVQEFAASPLQYNAYSRRFTFPKADKGRSNILLWSYMGNDAGISSAEGMANYPPDKYKFQSATIFGETFNKGFLRSEEFIITQAIFNNGAISARWDSFVLAERELAQELNLNLVDASAYFGTNIKTNVAIGGDGVHPTATQHDSLKRLLMKVYSDGWTYSPYTTVTKSWHWVVAHARPYRFPNACAVKIPPIAGNGGAYIDLHNESAGNVVLDGYLSGTEMNNAGSLTDTYTVDPGKSIRLWGGLTHWKIIKLDP